MTFLDLILARSADDDWIKVVFGVIVAIIWGLGALVSAVNKKAQDAKRRQQYGRLPVDVAKPTSPRAMGAGYPKHQTAKAPKPRAKRRPVVVAQPPVPAVHVYQAPPPISETAPPIAQSARDAAAAAAAPPANRIARLVRRPDSLRAALILNEILAPPPGLRPNPNTGRDV